LNTEISFCCGEFRRQDRNILAAITTATATVRIVGENWSSGDPVGQVGLRHGCHRRLQDWSGRRPIVGGEWLYPGHIVGVIEAELNLRLVVLRQ
jgi:hypothetical protein